jgi:hypothetical protein
MLPVRVIGGPGKEVPLERARTTREKKETVRSRAELPRKTRRPGWGTAWERIYPPLVEDMLMPLALRLENERRELHLIVPLTAKRN